MKKKTRCYIYTRVPTAIQVDGYSLDAHRRTSLENMQDLDLKMKV